MKENLFKALINLDAVAVAVDTTEICEKARVIHDLTPTTAAALGRTLTAGVIMGNSLKQKDESITLSINGGGPAGTVLAVANGNDEVKGYVVNPGVSLPLNDKGKIDVSGAVGKNGFITVIKDIGMKEPYIGKTQLVTGEIAEDIASYYATSEQQPCVIFLSVVVGPDLHIEKAGGIAVFLLPNASETTICEIESRVSKISNFTKMLKEMDVKEVVESIFEGVSVDFIEGRTVEYKCNCSKDATSRVIVSLGEKEIRDIIEEDGKAEVVCKFCNTKYNYNKTELETLLEQALK